MQHEQGGYENGLFCEIFFTFKRKEFQKCLIIMVKSVMEGAIVKSIRGVLISN